VFTKGWESYQNKKEIENVGAFLYQIARNSVVDHYRYKEKAKTVSPEFVPQIADTKIDLHQKAVASADLEAIKSALQNLKKDYQDVIIWHYLEDISVGQIANILNKPEGTVRVMIHRGLKALQGEIGQEG
jgi:RNA polymerase sigma-70 factor (ECF subfamily)